MRLQNSALAWLSGARRGSSRSLALAGGSLAVLALATAGLSGAAHAQASSAPTPGPTAQPTPPASSEVVVTGSRIQRRDFTSNSPIVTVNQQAFKNTADVAVEATLNKLPQFTPDQDLTGEANSGDVQPTGTHTIGISTVSLRGFGPNRNLVLADGQRLMPSNGELVVDINNIPAALIDHVEVITGGASAVYGADAVSGVVNFILKKNFQGLVLDAQYGITQAGDGNEFNVSALFGANFADDKGNVTFALEHYTRAPSYQRNRDFYRRGFADPTVANNEFFFTGNSYAPFPFDSPSQAAVDSIFTKAPPGGSVPGFGSANFAAFGPVPFYFNNDGTLYTGAAGAFGGNAPAGAYAYTGPIDGFSVAKVSVIDPYQGFTPQTALKTNQTNYYVTAPLNRWSLYGDAHYDFSPDLTAYVRGMLNSTHTHTVLFSTPFITGWGVNIPYNPVTDDPASPGFIPTGQPGAHFPVSAQLATLLNSRADPGAPWELNIIPGANSWFLPRSDDVDNTVWQFTSGLKGKFPVKDWSWELYGSHGQASSYDLGEGYASLARYQAMLSSPDYGRGASITGNQAPPNFGFGAATGTCTSGFYSTIFGGGSPSQDCVNSIGAAIQNRTLMEQNIVEFDAQGTLFHLPAGDLKISLGADYRDNSDQYTPDILQSVVSFNDQVAGVYPTAYMNAATSAREGYGELSLPVVNDLPLIKHFELELGARYSTYTAEDRLTGLRIEPQGGWTYKILGDWSITDWARLRGGYNLAVRTPNVGELFLGKQEVFAAGAATAYGDPCSTAATAPFGANPATNSKGAAGATSAMLICSALMTPTGASTFYSSFQAPGAPSPFGFVEQQGNSNLKPETAKTWTAGLVLSSPWKNPWMSGLRASVDWYFIRLTNAIEFNSVDNIKAACLTQGPATTLAEAEVIAVTPECQLLSRNPGTGAEAPTTIVYGNLATVSTSGWDVQIDWTVTPADIGLSSVPGRFQLSLLANYLDFFNSQSAPGTPWNEWAGTLGPSLTGTNFGAFKYRTNTTLTYLVGPATFSLNWRWLPRVHNLNWAQQGPCFHSTTGPGCFQDTRATHQFDLSTSYTLRRDYVLRFGINNLFDVQPPTTGAQNAIPGFSVSSSGAGMTNESLYDALGRRFYFGIEAKF
jgi:outer membrane receptor protein involved in Fe transport